MSVIETAVALKVARLIPRLGSDHEPEVVAAVLAIRRVLAKCGADLHDLAAKIEEGPVERIVYQERTVYRDAPEPAPRRSKSRSRKAKARPAPETKPSPPEDDRDRTFSFEEVLRVAALLLDAGGLNERELSFVKSMQSFAMRLREEFSMTPRQAAWWALMVDESGVLNATAQEAA